MSRTRLDALDTGSVVDESLIDFEESYDHVIRSRGSLSRACDGTRVRANRSFDGKYQIWSFFFRRLPMEHRKLIPNKEMRISK